MAKVKSIQIRLTLYFLLILLPLVCISLFVNYKLGDILEKQVGERSGNALVSSMEYVDLILQSIEETSAQIATDDNILKLLNHNESELSPQMLIDFQALVKQVTNVNSLNHSIAEIAILHSASGMMISSQFGGRKWNEFQNEDWYKQTIEANGKTVIYIPERDRFDASGNLDPIFNTQSVTYIRLMDLYGRQSSKNVLAITVRKETLLTFAKNLPTSGGTDISLFTGEGRWLAGTTGKVQIMPQWKDDAANTMEGELQGTDQIQFFIRARSAYSNWHFVMSQPENELKREMLPVRTYTIVIIVISCILALIISWAVYSWITSPLSIISQGMKQVQMGNLEVRLNKKRDDEFGFVVESFNTMVKQQKQFIRDTFEQQLRIAKTELKFIQSQINPHFLYNTLNSIYQMAKNYDANDIRDMTLNLSKFFRLSLNKGVDRFTMQETVEHLMYYIRIQQIRFGDRLHVRLELSEDTLLIPIQKLLLQPLVENAILHGLEKTAKPGELLLTACLEQHSDLRSMLKITISDNGVGMSQEQLSYIRAELGKLDEESMVTQSESFTSSPELFGLRNVKARLNMVYGKTAELRLDSEENAGTSVTILIPVDQEGNQGDER